MEDVYLDPALMGFMAGLSEEDRALVRNLREGQQQLIKRRSEQLWRKHMHIEMFAAAYLKETDIPPEEACLIEQHFTDPETGSMTIKWYFVKRTEEPDA